MEATAAPRVESDSGLFARNATGLVRDVGSWSQLVINFIPGMPVQTLAAGFFFAFALYPGGNFLLGLAMVVPMTIAFAYAFGLLTSMIPRSGGDYMLVSRIIHPGLGLISSFCITMAGLLSNAFFGIAVCTLGLGPGLIGIGLIGHHPRLVDWGTTVSASHWWQFGIGSVMFCIAALFMAGGWSWTLRVQNAIFALLVIGLLTCIGIAIFTSNSDFIANFNAFAQPYTHNPDTYHNVIATATKNGVNVHPAFSFSNTIPLIGVFAGFSIYSYWATFIGGEIRQASSRKPANYMAIAGVAGIITVAICAAILFRTFGTDFMTAANGGGMPAGIAASPTYFFLLAASVGNTGVAIFLVLSYIVFWPLITYISFLQPTRMIFAYAFDGILPKVVTRVSRGHSPYVAVVIATLMSIAVLGWAVQASSFFKVLAYAVLFQLVAMMLVGLTAVIVPWRRPDLYRATAPAKATVLGIPVVSIAGAVSIVSGFILWYLYLHYKPFGVTDKGELAKWILGTIAAAIAFYALAWFVRKSRDGVDINRAFAEIPPE